MFNDRRRESETTEVRNAEAIRQVAVASLAADAIVLGGCTTLPGAGGAPERHAPNDGSALYVDANGSMRMFSSDGSMIHMRDGVPMETADGMVIAMRENVLRKELRTRGTPSPKSR